LPQQQPPLVLFPAVSCNAGEIVTWHVRQEECLYFPDSATAVHDLIVGSGTPTETTTTDNDDDIKETSPMLPSIPVDNAVITHVAPKAVTMAVEDKPLPAAVIILPEPLDLEPFSSATALEELGMGRLMSALMAEQCKCGYVVLLYPRRGSFCLCLLNLLWIKTSFKNSCLVSSGLSQNLPLVCSNERWSVWSICMAYTPSFYPHSFVQNLFLPTQRNSFRTCGTTLLLERFETKRVSKEGPSQGVCTVIGYHRTIS
jgi:Replication stress response SDE2 C-terminal